MARVFTTALELKAEIDDFETLYFTRSWYGVGDFCLTIDRSKLNTAELVRGRLVMIGNHTDSVGIIREINYDLDETGVEKVTVRGRQLKDVLSRRIVYPPAGVARYTDSDAAETLIKALILAQAGTGAAVARRIPLLSIAADSARGATYLISARYSNLMDELTDCAYATNISPTMTIDAAAGTIVFDVAEGVDRRSSQIVNGRAIFSPDFDTLKSARILHSDAAYRNILLVGGQGVGAARTIVPVYTGTEPTGFDRREQWIDARDLSSTPDLTARGEAKAIEYGNEDYLEAEALDCSPLAYRTEYDLGDLCTLSAFGEVTDARISEVRESWEKGVYSLEILFGKPYPTITGRVAQSEAETAATLNANE